jgi:hypothetical protein
MQSGYCPEWSNKATSYVAASHAVQFMILDGDPNDSDGRGMLLLLIPAV